MTRKLKAGKTSGNMLEVIVAIVLVGTAICILGVAVISLLVGKQVINLEAVGYGITVILLLASYVVVRMIVNNRGGNRALSAAIGIGTMMSLLIVGNLISGAGNMSGVGQSALVVVAGGGCAIILKKKHTETKRYRTRKY